jgi:hypothetical protein
MRYRKGSEEPYASLWRLRLVPTFWDIGGERARHAAKRFSGSRRDLLENHHLGKAPQAGSVLQRKSRTAAACLGGRGKRLRDAVRYGSMRHGAREERGRSALRKTGSGRPAIQVNKGLAALN